MTQPPVARHAALVLGASGALGGALANALTQSGQFVAVWGTSRNGQAPQADIALDFEKPEQMSLMAEAVAGRLQASDLTLHTVVIAAGILHEENIRPERRIKDLAPEAFTKVMQINALGPLLAASALLPLLPRNEPARLAAISARVGSISDNQLGGWYSYRCAKAALNMGFKTLSIETRRSHPGCVLTLMQPGTVDSPLSQPFQKNVAADKLFEPAYSASQMLKVLDQRTDPSAHLFVDWAGTEIPY